MKERSFAKLTKGFIINKCSSWNQDISPTFIECDERRRFVDPTNVDSVGNDEEKFEEKFKI